MAWVGLPLIPNPDPFPLPLPLPFPDAECPPPALRELFEEDQPLLEEEEELCPQDDVLPFPLWDCELL